MNWAEDLCAFAVAQLGVEQREALGARGVSDEQIDLYRIGYIDRILPVGLPEGFVTWARGGDKLDDVFVLPLTNSLGEVRGFQFRHVDRDRTGYQDYFLDRNEAVLFGLGQAVPHMWRTRSVYLVEGAFDLFPVQRAYPGVFATLTSQVNPQTARLLKRLVQKVWMGYDMDGPGRLGCQEFEKKYGDEFQVYIVAYPRVKTVDGKLIKDPADLWEVWGDSQLKPFIQTVTQSELF